MGLSGVKILATSPNSRSILKGPIEGETRETNLFGDTLRKASQSPGLGWSGGNLLPSSDVRVSFHPPETAPACPVPPAWEIPPAHQCDTPLTRVLP